MTRLTIEFEVSEDEAEKIEQLIEAAKRIGITDYARDSHDPDADAAARKGDPVV